MPISDGEYSKLTTTEILNDFFDELEQRNVEFDDTDLSVYSSLLGAIADTLNSNQEDFAKQIYEAGYLSTATGSDLDKLVELIGIQRKSATKATGLIEFYSNNYVTQTYTIGSGTTVQTSGSEPISFDTTQSSKLTFYDDFEDGDISEYSGDTGSFTVQQSTVFKNSNALEVSATDNKKIHRTDKTTHHGKRFKYKLYINGGTGIGHQIFGFQDKDNYYRIVADSNNGRHAIEKIDGGVKSTLKEDTGASIPSGEWLDVVVEWNVGTINSEVIDSNGNSKSDISVDDTTWTSGGFGYESGDGNVKKFWDFTSSDMVASNIEAQNSGVDGNVGSGAIDTLPSIPNGVNSVNNPLATGDGNNKDRNSSPFLIGSPQETDSELRDRAKNSTAIGASGTYDSILANVLEVTGVTNSTVFFNKKNSSNNNLPAKAFEVVARGYDEKDDVAQAIFDKKAITGRPVGGNKGTKVTGTATADVDGRDYNIDFSKPTEINLDLTIDFVYNENDYVGDNALKDDLVGFVGGSDTDDVKQIGLGIGEDVYKEAVRTVVDDENGVVGVKSITFNNQSTTTKNSLTVVDITDSEVAILDSGKISLTKTKL